MDAYADTEETKTKQDLIKFDPSTQRPLTCAWSKLNKSDAISALISKMDAVSSEEIWYKLNSKAYKLYHLNLEFNQLTSEELKFWKQFKQEDIFEAQYIHRIILSTSAFALRSQRIGQSSNKFRNQLQNLSNRDLH